ncbi:Ger(x)C family spore germination protein [Paenibacillus sp. strain BS8-2]
MKIRLIAVILVSAVLLPILTGCWNRMELNEIGIAIGLGIDKKKNGQYGVSVQVVDPSEAAEGKGSSGRAPVTMFEAEDRTIIGALRKMTTMSPRRIYFSHLRILVLGEALARSGIGDIMDFLFRSQELRPDYYVIIARDATAQDTLKVLTPLNKLPADSLFSSLLLSERLWAPTSAITTNMLLRTLLNPGKELILTGVRIHKGGDIPSDSLDNVKQILSPSYLQFSGLSIFKGDKLVGWLNEKNSKGYNFVADKVRTTIGDIRCPDGGTMALELVRTHSRMKTGMKDGQPYGSVLVEAEAAIPEAECSLDLSKQQNIEKIQREAEHRMVEGISDTISLAQNTYKSDIFGFGYAFHRSNRREWSKLKHDWNEHFSGMPIEIKANIKIRGIGTMANTFKFRSNE